jgi:hypothetical protein
MTNEEHIEEILIESEIIGIRKEVLELSKKIKSENSLVDNYTSIEQSFDYLKNKLN